MPILVRAGGSEPPESRIIGVNPESIALIEPAEDDPDTCWMYVDGIDKPYRVDSPAGNLLASLKQIYESGEEEECPKSETAA